MMHYFLRKNFCVYCERFDQLYIGKDLVGYKFIFIVNEKHKDADTWISDILNPKNILVDGCGKEVDKNKFIELIKSKINEESFAGMSDIVTTDGKFDYLNEKEI